MHSTEPHQNGAYDYDQDSLAPKDFPFKLKGKTYILREPSAEAGRLYRNAQMRGATMVQTGDSHKRVSVPDGIADCETILVQASVFETYTHNSEDKERPVPMQIVRAWPDRAVADLCKRAKKMGGFDKDEREQEEHAGNLLGSGTATSDSPTS